MVLDTAVSVGLMNRATAQSLLSGEGASGRRNPVISSAAPNGAFAPPQPLSRQQHVLANSPPVGACLTGIRGGQQQTNSHWNEARGVRRLPSGRQGGPAHRSSQGGAKEGQPFPAESYLRFSTTQENTIGSVQPWYIDPPPSQTLSPDPVRPQAVSTLHSGAEGKQRPLTSHLQDPLQFHTAGLLGDLPMQHLLHLPINGSILTGGNAGDLATSIAPSGQTLTLGASPYLTEEGISTQGAKLHCRCRLLPRRRLPGNETGLIFPFAGPFSRASASVWLASQLLSPWICMDPGRSASLAVFGARRLPGIQHRQQRAAASLQCHRPWPAHRLTRWRYPAIVTLFLG